MSGFFTVVFIGDVRKLGFNPMTAETIFGEVAGVSVGDLLEVRDQLEEDMEALAQELKEARRC